MLLEHGEAAVWVAAVPDFLGSKEGIWHYRGGPHAYGLARPDVAWHGARLFLAHRRDRFGLGLAGVGGLRVGLLDRALGVLLALADQTRNLALDRARLVRFLEIVGVLEVFRRGGIDCLLYRVDERLFVKVARLLLGHFVDLTGGSLAGDVVWWPLSRSLRLGDLRFDRSVLFLLLGGLAKLLLDRQELRILFWLDRCFCRRGRHIDRCRALNQPRPVAIAVTVLQPLQKAAMLATWRAKARVCQQGNVTRDKPLLR